MLAEMPLVLFTRLHDSYKTEHLSAIETAHVTAQGARDQGRYSRPHKSMIQKG